MFQRAMDCVLLFCDLLKSSSRCLSSLSAILTDCETPFNQFVKHFIYMLKAA